jgi:prophage tail gpP-like protein
MYKNPYKTVGGETATSLSTQMYGNASKAYLIVAANPHIYPEFAPRTLVAADYPIPPGIFVVIPPQPTPPKQKSAGAHKTDRTDIKYPRQINVSPDSINANYSEEVGLYIDGKVFKYFDDLSIDLNFDSIADTFSFTIPFDSNQIHFKRLMKPFSYKEVAVYIGGKKELTGNIVTIKTDSSDNSKKLTIDGYSKTGILNDCCPSPKTWPINVSGLTLMDIANKLCEPYGIGIVFEDETVIGAAFTGNEKIEMKADQKIVNILTPLAKMRGLVISNTRHGELLFHKTDTDFGTHRVESGKPPCYKSNATYNGQNRYSDITLTKSNASGKKGARSIVRDQELANNGVFRSIVQSADNSEPGNLRDTAISKIGRTIAESVSINIECFGWRRGDGLIWLPGQKIQFKSPDDFIFDFTEMMVRTVKFSRTNNAETTSIGLCLPEVYSGSLLTKWPWSV